MCTAILYVIIKFSFEINWSTFHTLDTSFRFDINEPLLSSYSLFWTNFWYLFIFLFSFYLLVSNFFVYKIPSTLLLLLSLYFYEVSDFWITNNLCAFLGDRFNSVNFFLFNNINKYHPLLFYLSVFLLFLSLFLVFYGYLCCGAYWSNECCLNSLNNLFHATLSINFFALYLGSWWAIQEGTWGGWWNWDASETFGLIVGLVSLSAIHWSRHVFITTLVLFYLSGAVFFFIIMYVLIQLNFELVSHNFGIKFFFFFNNVFFLMELLVVLFYCLLKLCSQRLSLFISLLFIVKFLKQSKTTNKYFVVHLIALTLLLIFFVSFSSIINYFAWTFLEINISNSMQNNATQRIDVYVLAISSLFLVRGLWTRFLLPLLFLLSSINYCWCILLLTYPSISSLKILHWFFLIFLLINFMAFNLQLSVYFMKTSDVSVLFSFWSHFMSLTSKSPDTMFLDSICFWFCSNNCWLDSFNLFYLPLYFISSSFFFLQSTLIFSNLLSFQNACASLFVYIEIPYLQNVNITSFFFLLTLSYYLQNRKTSWFF